MYSQFICKYTHAIETVIESDEISNVYLRDAIEVNNIPVDTLDAQTFFEQPLMTELVCKEIIDQLIKNGSSLTVTLIESKLVTRKSLDLRYQAMIREKIRDKITLSISSLGKFFYKKRDALIVSTYLPVHLEVLLNLGLKQWPRFFTKGLILASELRPCESEARARLFRSQNISTVEDAVAHHLLDRALPSIFLENFELVSKKISDSGFPTQPKFIFTSNSFMTDEIFKHYTAFHIDKGVPYFVAQHGNNYGTLKYATPTVEEETCTKFLSWGWESTNVIPNFLIKKPNPRLRKRSQNLKDLLIILGHKNFSYSIQNAACENEENVAIQRVFFNSLDPEILRQSVVRFHPYSFRSGEMGLIENVGNLNLKGVNYGNSNVGDLIENSRIVVHGYDSTGILETLSANIPTVAFWHKESSLKTRSADGFYEILEDAGIIHFSGESASELINRIWSDIDEWWLSEKVQHARQIFCQNYARRHRHPVKELVRILGSDFDRVNMINSRHD
jgi:putative transferase (TIGR04331 family)